MTRLTWDGSWRDYHKSTGTWDATWYLLADEGTGADLHNNAKPGSQVKIDVEFEHRLVTGQILDFLSDADKPGIVTLRSSMVMRRE